MSKINYGQNFEKDVQQSCKKEKTWFMRIKDVYIPFNLRNRIRTSRNDYDCLVFNNKTLFPLELKTTDKKSISMKEEIIKAHQVEKLAEANTYEDVIAGFLFNFRNEENSTFFVPIEEYQRYKNIAQNQLEHSYKAKVNRASIPIGICKEIGVEVLSVKKRVHYHYFIKQLTEDLIAREKEFEDKFNG
ncbi:hypothetical protein CIL05_07840 [Virgibacillus profundi]|uniref:Uncharacterized protein n=1 Tax=Virgibacillus profundi TaxID=2024555 RepID=A0A2A2IH04_9BACI|nr:hypothetical protein [Virgibacillus profundi]PAV30373.1 hypothetical protein CIL05_07840 [Virgibacillus profundi]PXY54545.1 hypothetical protein CIT14_07925 [Virgibacillus profundi]